MIGAVVYRLKAENAASLTELHGRLLHGAFFQMLSEADPAAAQALHDAAGAKGFSAGLVEPEKGGKSGGEIEIIPGQIYRWRVCGLSDRMLEILLALSAGTRLRAGRAQLQVVERVADGSLDTGVVAEEELIAGALGAGAARALTFQFLTPATFRREDMDYPLPLPELVFGSLAKRWTENRMPLELDHGLVRDMAWHVKPFSWQGRSVFGYLSKGRGVTGFKGTYTYSLEGLDRDWRQIFMMLGQYAVFAGVGRLTAQGFGRVRFSWR